MIIYKYMIEKNPALKGKGLEIGQPDSEPVLLGKSAIGSLLSAEAPTTEPTLKGKGLDIGRNTEPLDTKGGERLYLSTKNGDIYVTTDLPAREGLVRLRNTRNGSIATLSADVLDDPDRFTPYAHTE